MVSVKGGRTANVPLLHDLRSLFACPIVFSRFYYWCFTEHLRLSGHSGTATSLAALMHQRLLVTLRFLLVLELLHRPPRNERRRAVSRPAAAIETEGSSAFPSRVFRRNSRPGFPASRRRAKAVRSASSMLRRR